MKKLSATTLVLILLGLALAACGPTPQPTAVPTPIPPTKTPAPTATPTPLPGLALGTEPFRSAAGGYSVRYPEGWQLLDFMGMVIFFPTEEAMEAEIPTEMLVMIEGGPLADLSLIEADLSAATDSRQMLDLALQTMGGNDSTFQAGEVHDVRVGKEQAAYADISGEESGVAVAGRLLCIHLGENGVNIVTAGPADRWIEFVPTFEAMVASMTFFPPETPTPEPEPTEGPAPTAGPAPTLVGGPPEGFAWRVGGESSFEEGAFGSFRGLDIGPDGQVYVADSWQGVLVFSPDGETLDNLATDIDGASDVKVGPDGNLYVASWGSNAVYIFSPQGAQLGKFGEVGKDAGEFGSFSPEFLAVCPDGRVYVADENEDADGNSYERVQIFDAAGTYIAEWNISAIDDFFDISGMDCDADGNVFLTGYFGDYVLELDAEGSVVAKLGRDALSWAGAYGVAAGAGGTLYVGTWDGRVVVLNTDDVVLGEWGVPFEGPGNPAEGQVYHVYGIAADEYGYIYFSDYTGDYTYLTKFLFGKG